MGEQLFSPPRDNFNLAYVLYFLLGTSYLLPWSTFISAIDYFSLLYTWGNVNRVFTVAYMILSVASLFLIMLVGLRVPAAWLVNTGLAISLVVLTFIPAMNSIFISNNEGTVTTYVVTVIAVGLTGIGHGLIHSSLVASIGRYLPPRYMQALTAGAGLSGLLSSILRISTKAMMPQTESGTVASAYLYFLSSVLIIIVCLMSYNLADRLPVIWYYKHLKGPGSESIHLLNDSAEDEKGDSNGLEKWNGQTLLLYKHVWNEIQGYALSLAFIYLITVSIIPGYITEDLKSSFFGDWYAILLVFCSNIFDVVGRSVTCFSIFTTGNKTVIIGGSLARVIFYPLYYLCVHGPAFFQSEVVAMIITCFFGFTGGYFTSVLFLNAPKSVPLDEAEAAGFLLVTLMQLGLAGASILQWVWVL